MVTACLTPPARMVWGHPGKEQKVLHMEGPEKGKPRLKQDGTPRISWACGLAFAKQDFGPVWQAMNAEALSGYPNGTPPRFSYKLKDGDGLDDEGKPFADREGYAGCWVLTISTEAFCPPVFKFENGTYRQLTPQEYKTGDWFVADLIFQVNVASGTNTPSLYVNPKGFELIGYGKEIVGQGAINPMQAFGGRQYQLPPGVSATPIGGAPAGVGMPTGQPGQPGPGQMPPAAGAGYPPPQGAPGGYPPPQGAPGGYPPPQGAPGGYPPPQGAPGGYPPPQGAPGGYPPSQGAPGGYPPSQGAPGGYPPPQGAPGGYPPPQGAPGGYPPPQGAPGGYPPPNTGFVQNAGQQPPQYGPPGTMPPR